MSTGAVPTEWPEHAWIHLTLISPSRWAAKRENGTKHVKTPKLKKTKTAKKTGNKQTPKTQERASTKARKGPAKQKLEKTLGIVLYRSPAFWRIPDRIRGRSRGFRRLSKTLRVVSFCSPVNLPKGAIIIYRRFPYLRKWQPQSSSNHMWGPKK